MEKTNIFPISSRAVRRKRKKMRPQTHKWVFGDAIVGNGFIRSAENV
jgi:hypothetical protein